MVSRAVVCTLGLAAALSAQQPVRVTTPNFELYTNGTEAAARAAIDHLEAVRAFFQSDAGPLRAPSSRVRIIAFRTLEEYRRYGPSDFSAGHYQAAPERDCIVILSLAPEYYSAAVHEFVHFSVRSNGLKLPLWLAEGLPEFYSTLEPLQQGRFRLGVPPPGHMDAARRLPPQNFFELLNAGGPRNTPVFYARSWALTHMLASAKPYRSRFPQFLRMLADGADSDDALSSAFGVPFGQIWSDYQRYCAKGGYSSEVVSRSMAADTPRPDVALVSSFDWLMVLAELEAGMGDDLEVAKRAYERVAEEYPERPEPTTTLGRLALKRGALEEARLQFARAVQRGTSDADVYVDYAELIAGREDGDLRVGLLRKALVLRPSDPGIERKLAMALFDAFQYSEARERMLRMGQPPVQEASGFYRVLAYLNDQMGDHTAAKTTAVHALAAARTDEDRTAAERLIEFLDRPLFQGPQIEVAPVPIPPDPEPPSPPPARPSTPVPPKKPAVSLYPIQGELVYVDCLGSAIRVWLRVGGERLAFLVEDVEKLVIRRGNAQVARFFFCGVQNPRPVTVRYEMRRDRQMMTQGVVRELVLR